MAYAPGLCFDTFNSIIIEVSLNSATKITGTDFTWAVAGPKSNKGRVSLEAKCDAYARKSFSSNL